MSKIIAVVRLAQGQVAFYDELTGTHLTMGNPIAEIADHMNTSRIKRAVQNNILNLVTGSFTIENTVAEAVEVIPTPKAVKAETIKEAVAEVVSPVEEVISEVAEAVAPVTEVIEEIPAEEVKTEETVEEATEVEVEVKTKGKKKK